MKDVYSQNRLSINTQERELGVLSEFFAGLSARHVSREKKSTRPPSPEEKPKGVITFIKEEAASHEVAFQTTITLSALEKVKTTVRLIQAQKAWADRLNPGENKDVVTCIGADMVELNDLFEKAATSMAKTRDVKEVTDVLSHAILPLFMEVYEDVNKMGREPIPQSLTMLTNGQLIEEIALQRLNLTEIILKANGKHLEKVSLTLDHASYIQAHKTQVKEPKKTKGTLSLLEEVDVRLKYADAALEKGRYRIDSTVSYMKEISAMGTGDPSYFYPIRYTSAPIRGLF